MRPLSRKTYRIILGITLIMRCTMDRIRDQEIISVCGRSQKVSKAKLTFTENRKNFVRVKMGHLSGRVGSERDPVGFGRAKMPLKSASPPPCLGGTHKASAWPRAARVRKMCFTLMLSMARQLELGSFAVSSRLSEQSQASLLQWVEKSFSRCPAASKGFCFAQVSHHILYCSSHCAVLTDQALSKHHPRVVSL
jgi:hypothetical protein